MAKIPSFPIVAPAARLIPTLGMALSLVLSLGVQARAQEAAQEVDY